MINSSLQIPVGNVSPALHAAHGDERRRRFRALQFLNHLACQCRRQLRRTRRRASCCGWAAARHDRHLGPEAGSKNGGEFKPISTSGDVQISEHMPLTAKQMKHLSIVRSMSTREADHNRGRYYMHTGYVPNPTSSTPATARSSATSWARSRKELEIPPFVSIGGGSDGPGLPGHELRAVRGRQQRRGPQRVDRRRSNAMPLRSQRHEHARRRRKRLHPVRAAAKRPTITGRSTRSTST